MTSKKLAAALVGTSWQTTKSAPLSLSSPQKLGSFSIDAVLPAEQGVLDFVETSVALVLQVAKLDTGHFLLNAPMRSLISQKLGSTARWFAEADAITITGSHSLEAAGEVEVAGNVLQIPASMSLNHTGDTLIAEFTAQYIFPHVKLPLPGVPEVWDLPIDLAGTLELELAD